MELGSWRMSYALCFRVLLCILALLADEEQFQRQGSFLADQIEVRRRSQNRKQNHFKSESTYRLVITATRRSAERDGRQLSGGRVPCFQQLCRVPGAGAGAKIQRALGQGVPDPHRRYVEAGRLPLHSDHWLRPCRSNPGGRPWPGAWFHDRMC